MAQSRRHENRLLSADEAALVADARHPKLADMSGDDLRKLARVLRERRDKATRAVRSGNRAARGTDNAGAAESGNRQKAGLIQAAIARVNKEFARRGEPRA